ncbi:hypothetical protein [Halomicrobium salinisoli]|uniref:DUF7856 family protein n=1 Tax=Halomicrobium salinisoli TaxID=2878391 RepID=UPI001CF0CBA5|nr:hypothetical protein [Halomicrobium salinisoli]
MILRIDGRTYCGAVADLRERSVDPDALAAAIRGDPSPYSARCPTPGPVHERVGVVGPGASLAERGALAAAARSRGLAAPQDDERARLRERLDAFDAPGDAPRPSPPPDDELARLRERVAELRGRVRAAEDRDEDPGDARQRLREAATRLSELETERAAATEARDLARERRDRREERMRLEDRLANLDRAARAHLADAVREGYRVALAAQAPASGPDEADSVAKSLAVLRVARVRAPVVLASDRLDPAAAAEWIGAPVAAV